MHLVLTHTVLRHNGQFHRRARRSRGASVEVLFLCAGHKQESYVLFSGTTAKPACRDCCDLRQYLVLSSNNVGRRGVNTVGVSETGTGWCFGMHGRVSLTATNQCGKKRPEILCFYVNTFLSDLERYSIPGIHWIYGMMDNIWMTL